MRIAITSAPNFVPKFGRRWLHTRRVALLLAMTVLNLCHSEEARRADVGIRFPRGGRRVWADIPDVEDVSDRREAFSGAMAPFPD